MPLTKKELQKAVSKRKAGHSWTDIAEVMFGVSRSWLYVQLKKAGLFKQLKGKTRKFRGTA